MPNKPSPKTILANGDDYVRRLSKAAAKRQLKRAPPTRRWPKEEEASEGRSRLGDEQTHPNATTLLIPWKKKPANQPREIIAPSQTASPADLRPIRAETRAKLISAIATGRRWLEVLPPGCAKLATKPRLTGSEASTNTIGTVGGLTCCKAPAAVPPAARRTSGASATNSGAYFL